MDDKNLIDEIYRELADGLKRGDLNWTHFIAKHGASKGLLYSAIGRFFQDLEPEARALNEAQTKTGEARLQLESLNQQIEKADKIVKKKNGHIARLEQKQDTLQKKAETLEGKVTDMGQILEKLRDLEKLGLGRDRLDVLHSTISEIGSKRGLKPANAADAFFADLKDYDAKTGFEQELERLAAATEAARLEADRWSTEARACEKRHKNLQKTIDAMQSLKKRGVRTGQVVSWNRALASIGGVEDLEKCLERYGSVHKALEALHKERQHLEARVVEARAVVKTLAGQQAELETSIKTIREMVIQEIEKVSQASVERISRVAQEGSDSIAQVGITWAAKLSEARSLIEEVAGSSMVSISQTGETALGQLKEAMSLIDQVTARALEVSIMVDRATAKVANSRKLKEDTEMLVAGIERAR